ncbi:MAG: peptidoglycan bridge formation glycyltransferase FemA/FemB family protein [Candidatus Sungiibacteriota bacterium]
MMPPSFLQSLEWEQFEAALGRTTRRIGGALIVQREMLSGFYYWYCPRPAVLTESFLAEAKKMAKQDRGVFLKIDPAEEMNAVSGAGGVFRPACAIQPRQTSILDLAPREDNLLAVMHEKTRYNIRLAERKGVQIKIFQFPISDFQCDIFWRLLQETAKRDGFQTHQKEYYKKMLEIRSDAFSNELFFAEYQGEVIAAALINFHHPLSGAACSTYLHGASARSHREVMAPHLLQWRVIQEARRRGCEQYDFWGIDEQRWPGVTRFKRGFGGREIMYPESVDIVYHPIAYAAYKIAKKIKLSYGTITE